MNGFASAARTLPPGVTAARRGLIPATTDNRCAPLGTRPVRFPRRRVSSFDNRDHQGLKDMKTQDIEGAPMKASLPATECEMTKHGITRVPVDFFHYREFRYTNLADAIAAAARDSNSA